MRKLINNLLNHWLVVTQHMFVCTAINTFLFDFLRFEEFTASLWPRENFNDAKSIKFQRSFTQPFIKSNLPIPRSCTKSMNREKFAQELLTFRLIRFFQDFSHFIKQFMKLLKSMKRFINGSKYWDLLKHQLEV